MNWTIKVSSKVEKYLKRLDSNTKARISEELAGLSILRNPADNQNVKALTGDLRGFHRLRVGDYRLILSILHKDKIIAVVNMAPRGDVYKK